MKIKMFTSLVHCFSGHNVSLQIGKEYKIDEKLAKMLIDSNQAIEIVEEKEEQVVKKGKKKKVD